VEKTLDRDGLYQADPAKIRAIEAVERAAEKELVGD
jgi:hypothetical protein